MSAVSKRQRTITVHGMAFDTEADCDDFISAIQLLLRLDDARDALDEIREQLRSDFDASGLDIEVDAHLDRLIDADYETLSTMRPTLGVFKTSGHPDVTKNRPDMPLWQISATVPDGAFDVPKEES